MSAPLIPNLLSLRGGRGGRGGFRGRRGPPIFGGDSGDAAVQGTDTDAAVSRLSAVELGYMQDTYAPFFVPKADGPNPRRLPIINRGTFTRTMALDEIIDAFLSKGDSRPKQIISLGAGTDTRPFRIFSKESPASIIYHELDFEATSKKKLQTVRGVPLLSKILTDIGSNDSGSWTSNPSTGGEYYSHGIDLRKLDAEVDRLVGLKSDLPTLLLSECCLCYLRRQECDRVISFFKSKIPNLAILLYEPMHLDDAFGDTMVANLAARHISMPGFEMYRNPRDQIKRLNKAGFDAVRYMTIEDAWEEWVPEQEKQRVHRLEGLDEVEEWKLLAGHYVVIWGHSGEGFDGISQIQGKGEK